MSPIYNNDFAGYWLVNRKNNGVYLLSEFYSAYQYPPRHKKLTRVFESPIHLYRHVNIFGMRILDEWQASVTRIYPVRGIEETLHICYGFQ